jgi:hypothetical protein
MGFAEPVIVARVYATRWLNPSYVPRPTRGYRACLRKCANMDQRAADQFVVTST